VKVETGSHDIGTGLYTIVAQAAADLLGVPMQRVTVLLGDSDLPPAPLTAGSSTTASILTVVAKACIQIRETLAKAAVKINGGQLHGLDADALRLRDDSLAGPNGQREPLTQAVRRVSGGNDSLIVEADNRPSGTPPLIGPMMVRRGHAVMSSGSKHKDAVRYAFGAHLVEVRVHHLTGEIRVPRLVGAFAAGRIINPRTARSQLMGGQIWGMSSALLEATEIDPRFARYANADLAEYLIPTNADVQQVETIFVPEEDRIVNPLGVKGLGELGVVGLNAAIANAVYHATGVRIRKLPIRIDEPLLRSEVLQKL
jgi:xanthine dehydrogenase YagR molybdenum-binding subunit